MRNWDRLSEQYLSEYAARGLSEETVKGARRELDRLGCWLKHRRPQPKLEEVGSEALISYIRGRTAYRSKATVCGAMSIMRGWGEFLVRQNVWASNPLRWMRGPKLRHDQRIPRRLNASSLQQVWEQAATSRRGYHRHLWLAALSLLYGTGLRRGELERLNLCDWCGEDGTLRIDGRKTGRPRQVAVPELTFRCIESYLPQRHNHLESLTANGEQALLVNKDGGRLSGYSISPRGEGAGQACGGWEADAAPVSPQLRIGPAGKGGEAAAGTADARPPDDHHDGAVPAHRRPRATRGGLASPDQPDAGEREQQRRHTASSRAGGGRYVMNRKRNRNRNRNSDKSPGFKLDAITEGYLAYLSDVSRKAPGTVRDVRCTLGKVSRQMQEHHPDLPLWKLKLEDYVRWLNEQRSSGGATPASLCKYLSHVRGLLDYAWRSGQSDRNVLDGFTLEDDGQRHPPAALSEAEAARLVKACPAKTRLDRRERMVVLLLYGCGLRTEELCRLDVADVNRERQELTVWHGKGDRQRVVPVPQGVFMELLAYLGERGGKRARCCGPAQRSAADRARRVRRGPPRRGACGVRKLMFPRRCVTPTPRT